MKIDELIESLEKDLISLDADKIDQYIREKVIHLINRDREFREDLISIYDDQREGNSESDYRYVFGKQGVLSSDCTGKIFEALMSDTELKEFLFYCNDDIAYVLVSVTAYRPDLVTSILEDERLMQCVANGSYPMVIRDILCHSTKKADADLVFSKMDVYGHYPEALKNIIYNVIVENYKKSLPDSLRKRSLFTVRALLDDGKLAQNSVGGLPTELQDTLSQIKQH